MKQERILIGNDHGGYHLKTVLINYLKDKGADVYDTGAHSEAIVRYPYYAAKVAREVSVDPSARGILICSTGIGMSIIANKFKGVRAALCCSTYQARMTIAHNNSNILCLGGKCTGDYEAIDIVETWLHAEYEGGRHDISLGLIREVEAAHFSDTVWVPPAPDGQ